ncbi:DUF4393 domain-containing protein [Elizabethkingia miricola]|uniref:DUF4393 domain-containing protein n=4 Tax=Elizabethkingia miricola TaxID=172045 RepID=UPI000B3591C7|nr:DUF4393 domain-containing protein [Elizabethkingia miricola]PSL87032.1 DUF4393 domain-containing protein [Elizabethkingia miricola]QHQ85899.1 DUF4393 domain-containing protein [Elizabethkingia miricola]UIO97148.1 DUF4393 domain-containing protein [Elizabethkingia miricola]WER13925.1 DUF4393 domain-containing protein [Elizabethkingia miricola]WGL74102.1 DUF4393 domain-containing protein [Elizabethkingia miricola]
MNDINNSLINIGNNKIVEKVYDDIISNPSKKVGETLGTIIDISNTLLWPIKWANARTRIYFVNNLKKYEEKLSRINLEKIIEVPTEISMPILERFTYVSNEEIGNAFVNLLTSASNIDTVQFAHPSFIQIIDRLSPDEARIIKYFAQQRLNVVPYITLAKYQLEQVDQKNQPIQHINTSQYVIISNKTDNLFSNIELNFKDNTGIYIDNLISLGILKDIDEYIYDNINDQYEIIEKDLITKYDNRFNDIPEHLKNSAKKLTKGMFELTDFGKLFVKSSII